MTRRPKLTLSNPNSQKAKESPSALGQEPASAGQSRGPRQHSGVRYSTSKPAGPGKTASPTRTRTFPAATMVKALLAVGAAAMAIFLLKRGFL